MVGNGTAPGGRRRRELAVAVERDIPGDPAVVFGILSDTNRWNRLTGVSPSTYTHELTSAGDPTSRTRIGHATYFGVPVRFAEEGEFWSGEMLRGERRFLPGGVGRAYACGALEARVLAAPGQRFATRAQLRCGLVPRGVLGYLLAPFVLLQTWLLMRRYMRWVERRMTRAVAALPETTTPDRDEPATAVARRALIAAADPARAARDAGGDGARAALTARSAAFAAAPIPHALVRRLLDYVEQQPDEALLQVRPFEVARVWGEDRRQVLRAFLYATHAGLFDLDWQVNCPVCRVGADAVASLAEVERRVHCDECDISFDVDFADNVEATFTANEAIRRVPRVVFCASSPFYRPHVHGYVAIPPGETRTLEPLPPGALLLRARGTTRHLTVTAAERPPGRGLRVRVTDDAIEHTGHGDAGDGLVVENATPHSVRLFVERAGWSADIARGSTLVELPEFIELFASDAPAAGMRLSVGIKAIVFTDIVASTQLYQQVGEARAFALVQEHWRDARRVAARHQGAIVKTMGDGLMCVFPTLGDAIVASLAMIDAADELAARRDVPFALRVGAHEGPCFAARASDRLDFFGTTVNIAARLGGVANGHQLALLSDAVEHPALRAVLAGQGARIEPIRERLRGIGGVQSISLASRAHAAALETGEHAPVSTRQSTRQSENSNSNAAGKQPNTTNRA